MATNTDNAWSKAAGKLNGEIDCADLAYNLGMERPGGVGNFRSPHHDDKSPSVACYPGGPGNPSNFCDFGESHPTIKGGKAVDLMMWHSGLDFVSAVKELARMYGITLDLGKPATAIKEEKTWAQLLGEKVTAAVKSTDGATTVIDYLESRKISRSVIQRALDRGSLGLNLWTSDKFAAGERGYGGPGVAFIVRSQLNHQVVAVDFRYIDPALNGGQKTSSQGEKAGFPWTSDWRRLKEAETLYVVESSINALTIESLPLARSAAVAIRGTGNIENIDWATVARGKQVISCLDNDMPADKGPNMGYSPGAKAAWRLHEILTGLDISCVMVDQSDWWTGETDARKPISDINDYLQMKDVAAAAVAIKKLEPWMIPGMSGDLAKPGKPRVWLPVGDIFAYKKYRTSFDFTRAVSRTVKAAAGEGEEAKDHEEFQDVAGFRVAAVARVSIASEESTMTGNADNAPTKMYALSVQVPRDGPVLQRVVVEDEKLHNLDVWKKLGPVYAPSVFSRMINIWERASHIGSRDAINFVGLAWRGGRLTLNEGNDCFFIEPSEQCPYFNLTFPSGPMAHGHEVMRQFQATFADNEVTIPLVWALGAHLKAFLGYWPHFVIQAEKSAGKSSVVKSVGTAVAMKQFSRQTLQSEYRIIGSVSYTSQPVAWGEFSTNKQELRTKAIGTLQESYQYESTSRGIGLKRKFLMCAPVLLSGEDVPVDGLEGKIVRTTLTLAKRGPEIAKDCPAFPMRQWLKWLASQRKGDVIDLHEEQVAALQGLSLAKDEDAGAHRMLMNYAGIATSWRLLCAFLGIDPAQGGFMRDLTRQMNGHIADTKASRHPWVWIMEKVFSEIARNEFRYPFKFDKEAGEEVLCIRTGHIVDHISQSSGLRAFWDDLPIKSPGVLKKQLLAAGVLLVDDKGVPLDVERTVHRNRVAHMLCISIAKLEVYGLHAVIPKESDPTGEPIYKNRRREQTGFEEEGYGQ